jgi:hypothetical protein
MLRSRLAVLVSVPVAAVVAAGVSASGLPECSEISQSPLDFTKIFTAYTG